MRDAAFVERRQKNLVSTPVTNWVSALQISVLGTNSGVKRQLACIRDILRSDHSQYFFV